MQKNGNDLFAPPTPTMMQGLSASSSGSHKALDAHNSRLWPQGIARDSEEDLFAATSHVMRMGASPLIGGDFLLEDVSQQGYGGRAPHFSSGSKFNQQSPQSDYSMDVDADVEDSQESYELETTRYKQKAANNAHARAVGVTPSGAASYGRKKKPFVSPDSSSANSSLVMHSAGSLSSAGAVFSPDGVSSSVEKLSGAVKNSKFGVSSLVKSSQSSVSGRRPLKPQHSVVEKSDLSQFFGTRQADESAGDDSNNSITKGSAAGLGGGLTLSTVSAEVTVCNCKKSKCLKLYCDCFAAMNYCGGGCNCFDCCNTTERESIRVEAIRTTKERNSSAFQTKINERDQHSTGCHCKNSQCLKKYCECYTGGAFCGQNCKCLSCMNYSGSVDLLKARSSAKDSDGPGSSSRKRKESPSSVAFLDASPPAIDPSKTGAGGIRQLPLKLQLAPQMQHQQQQQLQLQQRQQAVHLSPDLVGPTKISNRLAAAGAAAAQRNHHTAVATPLTGVSHVIDRSVGSHNKPINNNEDMQQPGAKRGKVAPTLAHTHSTPITATLTASARGAASSTSSTGRQLRSRKGHDEIPPAPSSVGSAKMQLQYAAPHGNNYSSQQQQQPQMLPLKAGKHLPTPMYAQHAAHSAHSAHAPSSSSAGKKRQVQFAPFAPVVYEYPFFGPDNPKTSKAIALKCLDYLEGKDIYAMSQVNSFWCKAAMDDALWE